MTTTLLLAYEMLNPDETLPLPNGVTFLLLAGIFAVLYGYFHQGDK